MCRWSDYFIFASQCFRCWTVSLSQLDDLLIFHNCLIDVSFVAVLQYILSDVQFVEMAELRGVSSKVAALRHTNAGSKYYTFLIVKFGSSCACNQSPFVFPTTSKSHLLIVSILMEVSYQPQVAGHIVISCLSLALDMKGEHG